MPKSSEYTYIALWGKQMGSNSWYINKEQERAANMNAPLTAIYYRGDECPETNGWHLAEHVLNREIRKAWGFTNDPAEVPEVVLLRWHEQAEQALYEAQQAYEPVKAAMMARKLFAVAYCNRSGVVTITRGPFPEGMLPIAEADSPTALEKVLGAACRHAHDNVTLLVPGIPEADNETAAYEAYHQFIGWLAKRKDNGIRVWRL